MCYLFVSWNTSSCEHLVSNIRSNWNSRWPRAVSTVMEYSSNLDTMVESPRATSVRFIGLIRQNTRILPACVTVNTHIRHQNITIWKQTTLLSITHHITLKSHVHYVTELPTFPIFLLFLPYLRPISCLFCHFSLESPVIYKAQTWIIKLIHLPFIPRPPQKKKSPEFYYLIVGRYGVLGSELDINYQLAYRRRGDDVWIARCHHRAFFRVCGPIY